MSPSAPFQKISGGWVSEMLSAFSRVLAFHRGAPSALNSSRPTPPVPKAGSAVRRKSHRRPKRMRSDRAHVRARKLASAGFDRFEIARRTGLSHDIVGLLLYIRGEERESAGGPVSKKGTGRLRAGQ